jgi:hypothetical protein
MYEVIIREKGALVKRPPVDLERELEWQSRTLELRVAQTRLLFALCELGSNDAAIKRFRADFFHEAPAVLICPSCGGRAVIDAPEIEVLQCSCLACGELFSDPRRAGWL